MNPRTLMGVAAILTIAISFPTVSFAAFLYYLGLPFELMSVDDLTRYSFGLYIALLFAIAFARWLLMTAVLLGSHIVETNLNNRAQVSRLLKAALQNEIREQRYSRHKRKALSAWAERLEGSSLTLIALYALALIIFALTYGSINIENMPVFYFMLPMLAFTAIYRIRDRSKADYVSRISQLPINLQSGYFFGLRSAEIIGLISLMAIVTGEMRAYRLLSGDLMLVSAGGSEFCGRVLLDNSDHLIIAGELPGQRIIISDAEVQQIRSNDPSCADEPAGEKASSPPTP